MAREESDRENLLQEMTALVERIEFRPATASQLECWANGNVVVGFRANGAASFFFGDDPVYQFNAAGQLRRAYCDGLLLKATGGRLVSMQRTRQKDEVQLISRPLSDSDQEKFIAATQSRLHELAGELLSDGCESIGQMPATADVLSRVSSWLALHDGLPVAATPRAG